MFNAFGFDTGLLGSYINLLPWWEGKGNTLSFWYGAESDGSGGHWSSIPYCTIQHKYCWCSFSLLSVFICFSWLNSMVWEPDSAGHTDQLSLRISPNHAVSIGMFVPTHLICQQRILLSTLLIASGLASEFGMRSTEEKKTSQCIWIVWLKWALHSEVWHLNAHESLCFVFGHAWFRDGQLHVSACALQGSGYHAASRPWRSCESQW